MVNEMAEQCLSYWFLESTDGTPCRYVYGSGPMCGVDH